MRWLRRKRAHPRAHTKILPSFELPCIAVKGPAVINTHTSRAKCWHGVRQSSDTQHCASLGKRARGGRRRRPSNPCATLPPARAVERQSDEAGGAVSEGVGLVASARQDTTLGRRQVDPPGAQEQNQGPPRLAGPVGDDEHASGCSNDGNPLGWLARGRIASGRGFGRSGN